MGQIIDKCCHKEFKADRPRTMSKRKNKEKCLISKIDTSSNKENLSHVNFLQTDFFSMNFENQKTDGKIRNMQTNNNVLYKLEECMSHEPIDKIYAFGKVIGGGHFGSVRTIYPYSDPSKHYAVKSIPKSKIKKNIQLIVTELQILKEIDHPNIVKFKEIYSDPKYFHIVTELYTGGELFDRIVQKGKFSENDAANITLKILLAVKHLHERNICHRDIKPENFLFENNSPDAEIKMIDFGLATKFSDGITLHTIVGSPYYVAPEVLRGSYDKSCDLWSIGVLLFIMLCGYPPFEGDNNKDIFVKILSGRINFEEKDWKFISADAKDLILHLMNVNQVARYTPEKALKHPWFKSNIRQCTNKKTHFNTEVLRRLIKFQQPRKFQKEILSVLVDNLSQEEKKDLREAFKAIDKELNGNISIDELNSAFKECNMIPLNENAEDCLKKMDIDNNGEVTFTDFATAAMDFRNITSKEKLWNAFKHFDVENKGYITRQNLVTTLQREGRRCSEGFLNDMMSEAENEVINFRVFCQLMRQATAKKLTLDNNVDKIL